MTIAHNKYLAIAYAGKSFVIGEQTFYPLKTPMEFILSIDKTRIVIGDQDKNVIEELDSRMERDDAELWLTSEGIVSR